MLELTLRGYGRKTCLHLGKSRFKLSLFIVPCSKTFNLSAVSLSPVRVVPVDCRGTWKFNMSLINIASAGSRNIHAHLKLEKACYYFN